MAASIARGYTVDKVYFESFPGHFVSGNLYRPTGRKGKLPGVLCPYGHWNNGRFGEESVKEMRKQIVEGAERFEDGGRYPLQARCVELARMGCVVFHYDMEGYADSQQISYRSGPSAHEAAAGDGHARALGPVQRAGRIAFANR